MKKKKSHYREIAGPTFPIASPTPDEIRDRRIIVPLEYLWPEQQC
jgi:hypothetical protein